MHQAHNIPWHLLASHLSYKIPQSGQKEDLDLWPGNAPRQKSDAEHFTRSFEAAIKEFSRTERSKYPRTFQYPTQGPAFPEAVLERLTRLPGIYCNLDASDLLIERWITRASENGGTYGTGEGDLADLVKLAFLLPDQTPLLMLANHPRVPLASLQCLSWGHSFGFDHSAQSSQRLYILINLLEATSILGREDGAEVVKSMPRVRRAVFDTFSDWDYPLQNVPQWTFLTTYPDQAAAALGNPSNAEARHELLKELWQVMYRYDMLMTELGKPVEWAAEVIGDLEAYWGFSFDET